MQSVFLSYRNQRTKQTEEISSGTALRALVALFFVVSTSCGGVVSGTDEDEEPLDSATYPPAQLGGGTISDGLAVLNRYRASANLQPVKLDGTTSEQCLGHLQYLAWEAEQNQGGACFLVHTETNRSNPNYSPAHAAAGNGSLLACDSNALSLGRAVDRWVNSLYHRIPLLSPGLRTVGAATHQGYVCLYFSSGTATVTKTTRITWPQNRSVDVPRMFAGRESPCPTTPSNPNATAAEQCPASGFIPTVTWYGPASGYPWAGETPAASLTNDTAGAAVPLLGWYGDRVPRHDPNPGLVPQTVGLVPASALPPNSQFTVRVGTGESRTTWRFSTGTRTE